MRIRCLKGFNDLSEGKWRSPGDEWEAEPSRLAEVNAAGYGQLAEEVRETEPKTAPEPPETEREPRSTSTAKKGTATRKRTARTAQRG